jgi:hypothetical protein
MVECLPITHKGLHSNHRTAKNGASKLVVATTLKKYTTGM